MTYSTSITIIRPTKETAFLPQNDVHAHTIHSARKAANGWVREERTHTGNTLKITHTWESKADYDAFETANKANLDLARAARHEFFENNGITSSATSVEE